MQFGNAKQKLAYKVISHLGIMNNLSEYSPTHCGTFPIKIDVEGSDLNIIIEVNKFAMFEKKVNTLYGDKENFKLKRLIIGNVPVYLSKVSF